MKKVFIIIFIVILLLIIGLIIFKLTKKENKSPYSKDLQNLINKKVEDVEISIVEYSNSGNSNGNIDSMEFDLDKKTIKTRFTYAIWEPITVKEYKLLDEDIIKIKEFIKKYNFLGWDKLPLDEELITLDDSSQVFVFRAYKPTYNSYSISYDNKIPDDGYPLLDEFREYLTSLLIDENKIKEYIEKE